MVGRGRGAHVLNQIYVNVRNSDIKLLLLFIFIYVSFFVVEES